MFADEGRGKGTVATERLDNINHVASVAPKTPLTGDYPRQMTDSSDYSFPADRHAFTLRTAVRGAAVRR